MKKSKPTAWAMLPTDLKRCCTPAKNAATAPNCSPKPVSPAAATRAVSLTVSATASCSPSPKRMTKKVILLYDGDAAGQKALLRGAEMLLQQGVEVRAAVLPPEHDPDSFLSAMGTQSMRELLENAPMAIDYFIQQFAQQSNLA